MAKSTIGEPRIDEELQLAELDPSPVEESPIIFSKEPDSSPSPPILPLYSRKSTSSLGGHGVAYYRLFSSHTRTDSYPETLTVARVQKYSSYAFTVFAALHITNTSIIPLATRSIPASDTYLLLTRPYYQSFPFEPLLVVGPLVLHVASGVALRLYRRSQNLKRYGAESRRDRRLIAWPALSGTSALGYILLPLVSGHAFINRVLPLWIEGGSSSIGLGYVSHAFARHPVVSFIGFGALVGVAAWHTVWGWGKWIGFSPAQVTEGGIYGQLRRKRRWYALNSASLAVTALWLAGGFGIVGRAGEVPGWVGREYDELYQRIPIIGAWM